MKRKKTNPEQQARLLRSAQLSGFYSPVRKNLITKEPQELTVGERIRRERFLRKMTLDKMSAILGISASYLGSIERGVRPATKQVIDKLHAKFDLSYDYLMEGDTLTSSKINQYVKESTIYSSCHNLNVLLNVCSPAELESCYELVHTFLSQSRKLKGTQDQRS